MADKDLEQQFLAALTFDNPNPNPCGPLDRALDLEPLDVDQVVITPREDGDDYVTAREIHHRLLGKLETALDELTRIARTSQHPRAYEVVNQLGKTLIDSNKDLLELKKRDNDLKKGGDAPTQQLVNGDVINNTIVLTSSDMLDAVRKKIRDGTI